MSTLFECVGFGAAILINEFGDEKDVVGAGEDGERKNGGVDGWKVIAGAIWHARREDNGGNGEDLNRSVDFSEQRWSKSAESCNDVDGGGADEDEYVAADHGNRHPKRNWEMGW